MIDSAEYSPDGKFLVLPARYSQEGEKKVPVALIDELIERRLSHYDLKGLLFVRSATAGPTTRKVKMEDLVGEDLTGKTVGVYFRNYEDSEWMSTDKAISVAKHDDGDYYFAFKEELTACYEGNCCHYDENAEEWDDKCETDILQGTFFWANETVLVTEKEVTNG